MSASTGKAIPARSLEIPPDDAITYATTNLTETVTTFAEYGVRLLMPAEIASHFYAFSLPASPSAAHMPGA